MRIPERHPGEFQDHQTQSIERFPRRGRSANDHCARKVRHLRNDSTYWRYRQWVAHLIKKTSRRESFMSQQVSFGIAGFGYAFGEDQSVEAVAASYVTDPERILRWGYTTFHRAADGTTATDLAAAAARDALDQAGVSGGSVGLVAIAISDVPEYLNWDSSAGLARKMGLGEVQTLLLNEGCASGVTGLASVAGVMALQPEVDTAVFAAVNRVSEFHRNRMTTNNAVHSDGAVAVVLRRDHPSLRWLATDQFTDPDLCDFFRSEYGGSVAPVPPPGWSAATAPPGHERVMAHFNKDPDRLRAFGTQVNDRIIAVVDGACKRAGVSRDQVAHLIHINDPDGINDLAPLFDLPLERTNFAIAGAHGHMGAADQLVALGIHLERGEVSPGDIVALVGTSIGMRWYCSLIQI